MTSKPTFERDNGNHGHEWSIPSRSDNTTPPKHYRFFVSIEPELGQIITIDDSQVTSNKPEARRIEGTSRSVSLTTEELEWLIDKGPEILAELAKRWTHSQPNPRGSTRSRSASTVTAPMPCLVRTCSRARPSSCGSTMTWRATSSPSASQRRRRTNSSADVSRSGSRTASRTATRRMEARVTSRVQVRMATRKKRTPTIFRIGRSPVTGKIYAGYARGLMWTSNKKDVTESFFQTVIDWINSFDIMEQKEGGFGTVSIGDGERTFYLTLNARYDMNPKPAKKVPKRPRRKKKR